MTTLEKLHRLVDEQPEEELDAALRRLRRARTIPRSVEFEDAPAEDEEISVEEEAAVQVARDELASGSPLVSHDEIKREFRSGRFIVSSYFRKQTRCA